MDIAFLARMAKAFGSAAELKLSDNPALIASTLVDLGMATPDTAATLVSVARDITGNPDATILEFLKSPDFMNLLTAKREPSSTQLMFCPHCGELIIG